MNNKIREFERASGLEIYGLGAKRDKWENAMSKFAELVEQDVIERLKNKKNHSYTDIVSDGRMDPRS
jgi:hypothetical protein